MGNKAVDYKVYQMWPPFLSLKILGLGRQVNWLYRPACVGRLCHSKYKMAATSDILYKSTALGQINSLFPRAKRGKYRLYLIPSNNNVIFFDIFTERENNAIHYFPRGK